MGLLGRLESHLPQSAQNVVDKITEKVEEVVTPSWLAPLAPTTPAPAFSASSLITGIAMPAFVSKAEGVASGALKKVEAGASSTLAKVKSGVSTALSKAETVAAPYVPVVVGDTVKTLGFFGKPLSWIAHEVNPKLVPALDHLQQRHPSLMKPVAAAVDLSLVPNALNRPPPNTHLGEPGAVTPADTGNEIIPFVDGDAYKKELLDKIKNAQKSIWLEAYEWDFDADGKDIAQALIDAKKAKPWLDIKLVTDNRQTLTDVYKLRPQKKAGSEIVTMIRNAKVGIHLRQTDLAGLRVNHRKLSVFDAGIASEVGFIGGQNLGEAYLENNNGAKPTIEGEYHDDTKRIRGPKVHDIAKVFVDSWYEAGGQKFDLPPASPKLTGVQGADAKLQILEHKGGVDSNIEDEMVNRINAEGTLPSPILPKIVLENGFGMTDRIYNALIAARQRGVDVTWVWGYVDDETATMAGYHMDDLRKAGVKVLQSQQPVHMKEYFFQQQDAEIGGSSNLDGFSNMINDEGVAEISGGGVATDFYNKVLAQDIAHAHTLSGLPPLRTPLSQADALAVHSVERVADGD